MCIKRCGTLGASRIFARRLKDLRDSSTRERVSRLVRVTRCVDVAASNSGREPRAGNVGPRVDVHRQRNELDAITLLRNEFFLAWNLAPFVICHQSAASSP